MDSTTLTENDDVSRLQRPPPPPVPALVIAWSVDEPQRAGELALFATRGERVLGRGEGETADARRVTFVRHRPAATTPAPALASPRISRDQLIIERDGGSSPTLHVRNVGRPRLLHTHAGSSAEVSEATVQPGDLLEIGGQLALLCVMRSSVMVGPDEAPSFAFGAPDRHGLVGESPWAWELRQKIGFIGRRAGHVLVRGASGTGKELVARALHTQSPRGSRPLVSRSAATFPEGIIDAELFGNARNYPNAGMEARPGMVGEADGSTLFLDEFAELPIALQAHLLRVLDDGEYTRLGESKPRRADFRLVAATNRDTSALKHDVLARFSYRLELADLNAHREDVMLLARHVLRRLAADDPEAAARFFRGDAAAGEPAVDLELVRALVTRTYGTHVRELRALLLEAVTSSPGERLTVPARFAIDEAPAPPRPTSVNQVADAEPNAAEDSLEPAAIQAALDRHNGVIEQAWRALGLPSRHALARLIRKHGLQIRKSPRS